MIAEINDSELSSRGRYFALGGGIGTLYLMATFAGGMQIASAVVSPVFIPSGVEVLSQPLFWILSTAATLIVLLKGRRFVASQQSARKKVTGGILFFLITVAVYMGLLSILLPGVGLFFSFFYFFYGLPLTLGLAAPAFYGICWAAKNDHSSAPREELARQRIS